VELTLSNSATCDVTSLASQLEGLDASGSGRKATSCMSQLAADVPHEAESLLCMPVESVPTACPSVVEWASVLAIARRALKTYNPLEVDARVGHIVVDCSEVGSGTIKESDFSDVIAEIYKKASSLHLANEFAMLMSGAVEIDSAKDLYPGLRDHAKNLPLYGRIGGASVNWVLQQIESEDVSEVIGTHNAIFPH
jgi:hypothetical protein